MKNEINGEVARCTGDINLVAALMAQGIALSQDSPVAMIDGDRGTYGSFRIAPASIDGRTNTEKLMKAWNGERCLPEEDGFSIVCNFIRARPRGVQSSVDLMDFAIEYLTEKGLKLPGLTAFEDIPRFVNALPNAESSYVLAYVWNRDICFQLYTKAKRKTYMEEGSGDETRRAILDTSLPKWKANELLSRLQG